jgi:flagellar operon protein
MTPVNGIGSVGGPGSTGYVAPVSPARRTGGGAPGTAGAPGNNVAEELQSANGVQFSKNAAERVQRRGMTDDPQTVKRLENGVDLAASKGSRSAVVMVDDNAFVVAVPNRTVVTALDKAHMRSQVFTNIDTAVIA